MEGIADGFAVDSCFYCDWIIPNSSVCPKCKKKMRYLPAEILSEEDLYQQCKDFKNLPTAEKAIILAKQIWHFRVKALALNEDEIPNCAELKYWIKKSN